MAGPTAYTNLDDAVKAAYSSTFAIGNDKRYEYVGAIYNKDGKFYYTSPSTSNEAAHVYRKITYPKGATLVALYHTHTTGRYDALFSSDDISMANALKIPYYMGLPSTGQIKVFIPGKSKMVRGLLYHEPMLYSDGEPVGKINVE